MTKHTAGPWQVNAPGVIANFDDRLVAVASGITPDNHAANAVLIAAAPELLEALEATNYELITLIPRLSGSFKSNLEAAYERNKAAIARAKSTNGAEERG